MKIISAILFVVIVSCACGSVFERIPSDFAYHSKVPAGSIHRTTYSETLPYESLTLLALDEERRLEIIIKSHEEKNKDSLIEGIIRVLKASLCQDLQIEIIRVPESASQILICTYSMHSKDGDEIVSGWEGYKKGNHSLILEILERNNDYQPKE